MAQIQMIISGLEKKILPKGLKFKVKNKVDQINWPKRINYCQNNKSGLDADLYNYDAGTFKKVYWKNFDLEVGDAILQEENLLKVREIFVLENNMCLLYGTKLIYTDDLRVCFTEDSIVINLNTEIETTEIFVVHHECISCSLEHHTATNNYFIINKSVDQNGEEICCIALMFFL